MCDFLVFSDLDDTFLARDKSLPEANLAALDLVTAHGGVFVPCTGRPVRGVPTAIASHPATRYVVASNGGVVADARTGEVLHRELIAPEVVRRIYERVCHLDVTFDVFSRGHVYAERRRLDAMGHFGIDEANLATIRAFREPHEETIPELLAGIDGAEKVTVYWATPADLEAAREALAGFPEVEVTTSHPKNLEFMAAGTSKGSALRWLCAHAGVPVARTYAFGDADNDVAMLVAAGDGVAMAGASAAALAAADHVCGDCNEGGVGIYLRGVLV